MYRIYLVEDDVIIARSIKKHLENWEYEVQCTKDFSAVTKEFAEFAPQLVLMDIGLPFYNGYYWCSEIRKISKVPIIFLSSAADNMNIVMAVNMGADDFIAKPFDLSVLTVKVQAMLRRTYDFTETGEMLTYHGVMLQVAEAVLTYQDKKVELTRNELRILKTLMENKEKVVSRDTLMTKLWESDCFVDENTLSVNVNRLRRKLADAGLEDFILTKKGILCFVIGFEQVPLAQWGYAAFLCFFLFLLVVIIDFTRRYLHHKKLEKQTSEIAVTMDKLSLPRGQMETDYQKMLRSLYITLQQQINELENGQVEQAEYFTMWVHQIKTPIAALRLLLAEEEDERSQEMWEELFSIEQYVEMALQFSRLSAKSTDFVIGEVSLDKVVREAIHKYARLFVRKKIKMELSSIDTQVLTDEKWLEFVIEQILSNAIKYTAGGTISIYQKITVTDEKKEVKELIIEDTGIGIAPEDLPRIFEKGYTGYNGHADKRSTGIGLYLCRKIMRKLSHEITIESEIGVGTKVHLEMRSRDK